MLLVGDRRDASLRTLERDFHGCRIAWSMSSAACPSIARRQRGRLPTRAFESLGCIVDDADPDFSDADEAFKTLRARRSSTSTATCVRQHRAQVKDTILGRSIAASG